MFISLTHHLDILLLPLCCYTHFSYLCGCSVMSNFCDPMDWPLPGSSVHRILQGRILKWVAMPSSRGSSQPRGQTRSPSLQADSLPTEPPTTFITPSKKKKNLLLWKTSSYVKVRDHWTPSTHNPALTVTNSWSTLFHLWFYHTPCISRIILKQIPDILSFHL